jgi:hypothetical protein
MNLEVTINYLSLQKFDLLRISIFPFFKFYLLKKFNLSK